MDKFDIITADIDAVIFDMDGTIIDSMHVWRDIDIEYFEKYGKVLPDTYQKDIEGFSVIETARYTKETFGFEDSIEDMMQEWNDMAHEHYKHRIPLKPNVLKFMQRLKSNGIKMGIATSNSGYLFEAFAVSNKLYDYIECAVTGEDVTNGKPNPECYLKVSDKLKVEPSRCLVFEDICMGLKAGISAGMKTVAVYDDFSASQWREKIALADYYIESYEELV